ncbi:MAG: DUF4233 domain-containing protein [Candidatus Nanopelagicales bacterium]
MKTLTASVLLFESLVVLLAIPLAVSVYGVPAQYAVPGGLILMFLCIYVGSVMRKKDWALNAGWVLQALVILTGFLVPWMFLLGVIFALLYYYAITVGKRGDAIKAARDAEVEAVIQGEAREKGQPELPGSEVS